MCREGCVLCIVSLKLRNLIAKFSGHKHSYSALTKINKGCGNQHLEDKLTSDVRVRPGLRIPKNWPDLKFNDAVKI